MKTFTVVRALARHRVLDVSLGVGHTCVLIEPGQVLTLGRNSEAQLGNGNTKQQAAPISVKVFQQRPAAVGYC
jgi:alpha-tubulin suppressor-like RCC1 family protein